MKISLNFLKDFVDIEQRDIQTIIDNLTVKTAELEAVEYMGKEVDKLVVGQIVSIENHPNSSKLHLLKVNSGSEVLDIVCGAPNVKLNAKVALVLDGGSVVGTKIKPCKVGGYMSYGMCCAEDELGIGDNSDGIIILPDDAVVGSDCKKLLNIDDVILEIDNKSLTNRPDLWGHYGFAREVAAILNRQLKPLKQLDLTQFDNLPKVDIKLLTKNCHKYSAIKVADIKAKVAPLFMRTRLKYCGIRSVNLLADLTNYIMLETGQPMHAFDAKKVGGIVIRETKKSEKFTTLDGTQRSLPDNAVAICDSKENPVAVAGIMGGAGSEITEQTNELLLESATFAAASIRKTAIELGLRTDASNRYEKSLDTNLCKQASARFLYLLKEIDKNAKVISSFSEVANFEHKPLVIKLDKAYVDKYLGQKLTEQQIVKILSSLQFKVNVKNDIFEVEVPTFRATKDISIPADLVEEIARIYGYDKIEAKANSMIVSPPLKNEFHNLVYQTKKFLADKFNYNELHTYIWKTNELIKELGLKNSANVKIKNSISQEYSELRESLVLSLLEKVVENKANFADMNLMEIAQVFNGFDSKNLVKESTKLVMAKASCEKGLDSLYTELATEVLNLLKEFKNTKCQFVQSQNLDQLAHPVYNCDIVAQNLTIGNIFALAPTIGYKIDKKLSIAFCEIDFKSFVNLNKTDKKFVMPSKFPATEIDLSFLADSHTTYAQISKIIDSLNYKTLHDYSLIEVYEDKEKLQDKKSITIKFVLGSHNKTLTAEDVNIFKNRLIAVMTDNNINFRY